MKCRPLCISAIFFAFLQGGLLADTVTLKSGEKIEGRITQENEAQVDIEVQISPTIRDTKTIAREEVQSIEKAGADEGAYAEIKGYRVDPQTSLPAEGYNRIIGVLQNFLLQFPDSKHGLDVRAELAKFQQESERVAAGEVKVMGRWLTKEEAARNKYDIEAQQQFAYMKQLAAKGDLAGALNAFDTLEKRYNGSRVYPDAVEVAIQVLSVLQRDVERRPEALKKEKADTERAIQMAAEPRKSQIKAAVAPERQRYEAAMAAAEKSGLKWKPYLPKFERSMDLYKSAVKSEFTRLSSLSLSAMRESIQLADEAEAAFVKRDATAVQKLIQSARGKWAQNKAIDQLAKRVVEAKLTPTPTPTATVAGVKSNGGGAPTGTAVKVADDDKPFYMTLPGAAAILVGLLVLIALLNFISKSVAKPKDAPRGQP